MDEREHEEKVMASGGAETGESPGAAPPPPSRPSPVRPPQGQIAPRVRVDLDPDTEREIEEAVAAMSAEELLAPPRRSALPAKRDETAPQDDRRRGRVLSVRGSDIFVDLGGKSQGVISAEQFPDGPPAAGTDVEVLVDHYDAAEGLLVLRRPGSAQEADWSNVQEGMIVEGKVTAANKGGVAVDLGGIRAFLPAGQIDIVRVPDLESLVGQTLRCQVTEVNRREKNIILSRRAILEYEREQAREKTWAELAEGQVRTGTVRSVKDFGAFVDLGGIDGLVPVREMAWSRVEDPNEIVRAGQQVQVQVLKVDRETRKITLGLKQLKESPWETAPQKYPVGTTVAGRVTKLMEFGAFVELEPGVEGLIHISELAHQRVRRVSDIVQEGQQVEVRVLRIDHTQRRIALSLKATTPLPQESAEPEAPEQEESPAAPKPVRKTPLKGGLGR